MEFITTQKISEDTLKLSTIFQNSPKNTNHDIIYRANYQTIKKEQHTTLIHHTTTTTNRRKATMSIGSIFNFVHVRYLVNRFTVFFFHFDHPLGFFFLPLHFMDIDNYIAGLDVLLAWSMLYLDIHLCTKEEII